MKRKLEKKLTSTRKKVSKNWSNYRIKKEKILNRRINSSTKQKLILELKQKTYKNIHNNWINYESYKDVINVSKPYRIVQSEKIKSGHLKTYLFKRIDENKIQKFIEKLRNNSNIRYIILILIFKDVDTNQKFIYSDSFTIFSINQILESNNDTFLNIALEKLRLANNYDITNLQLIQVAIKILYNEITKISK